MLKTEMRNPKTMHVDKMSALEIARIMNEENMVAVEAVGQELPAIAEAIDAITEALRNGGHLYYMGAGSSGRLGVLDAAECPPTFGVPHEMVVGIMAGGEAALARASENKEDDPQAGVEDLKKYHITEKDVVVGISAAGGAAYVVHALAYAKEVGCTTVGVTSNKGSKLDEIADISICPDTGSEVVTGSTRLKAGTAQKIILNMLSTGAMIRNGYVCENLMINLKPTNVKLRRRVISIVSDLTGESPEASEALLEAHNWNIKEVVEQHEKDAAL